MFSTQIGSVTDEADTIYLRQKQHKGIFVNFKHAENKRDEDSVWHCTNRKMPSGTRLWQGGLFFACVNLSKWKCSTLLYREHKGMV